MAGSLEWVMSWIRFSDEQLKQSVNNEIYVLDMDVGYVRECRRAMINSVLRSSTLELAIDKQSFLTLALLGYESI